MAMFDIPPATIWTPEKPAIIRPAEHRRLEYFGVSYWQDRFARNGWELDLAMFPFPFFMPNENFDPAGSQTFTGTSSFTVPMYKTLVVTMWGAGGEGSSGAAGGASTFLTLTAGGGQGGSTRTGGVATGGTINTNGAAGSTGSIFNGAVGGGGGSAPNGGAGGGPGVVAHSGISTTSNGGAGTAPGGGGGGHASRSRQGNDPVEYSFGAGGGGGSGAYLQKTWAKYQVTAGSVVSLVVGAGGAVSSAGGNGARGQINVTWS